MLSLGRLYPVCTSCHGAAGQGNQGMSGPKLAGQHGFYLLKQMQNFQSGARGTAPGDAKGRQMAAMAKGPRLSSLAALENLVAYIESLPDKAVTPTLQGDVLREKSLQHLYQLSRRGCPRTRDDGCTQTCWTKRLVLGGPAAEVCNRQARVCTRRPWWRQMKAMMYALSTETDYRDVVAYISTLAP